MSEIDVMIIEEKKDYNGLKENNFIATNEITVTITLNEYRDLVTSSARKQVDIEEANQKWVKYFDENNKLKEEIKVLMGQIANLNNEIYKMMPEGCNKDE